MKTTTATETPPQGGVQIRPGSLLDVLGATTGQEAPPTRKELMVAAFRQAVPPEALISARRSIWWQCRKGLYAVAAGGALWPSAYVLHEAGASPWYVPLGAVAVGGAALAMKNVRSWISKALWRPTWAGGALSLAAMWTTAAVQFGPGLDTPMPTLLLAGGTLAASPWWWVNRPRPGLLVPVPPPAIVAAEPTPDGPHPHQAAWVSHVGGPEGALSRSELIDPEPLFDHQKKSNGTAWIIDGGPKKFTYGKMRSALEEIKASLDMDFVDELVYLERDRRGRKTRARLLVLDTNPLMRTTFWQGPELDMATGRIPFAVYPDGSGMAYYILFDPETGPVHDIFVGSTGSGKTTGLRLIMAESLECSAVLLFDPKGGGDFLDLQPKLAAVNVTKRDIFAGLRGLEAVLDERILMLGERGPHEMGPAFGLPMVHAVIDEMPRVFQNSIQGGIIRRLVQEGRAAWMKVTVATQRPSVDGAFADDSDAREQLLSGNVILYRVATGETNRMTNTSGLDVAANALPKYFDEEMTMKTHGLGFALTGNGRDLVSRTMYMTPEASAWLAPDGQPMDERSQQAYLRGYAAGLDEYDEKNGDAPPVAASTSGSGGDVVTPIKANATKSKDKVLDYLRACDRPLKPLEISEAGVCSASSAYRAISELEADGRICKTDDGAFAMVS
jgi:hypothetical protein